MLTRKYPWRRYWLPSDSILVDDDGYLPNPAERYLASLNPGISDLAALREKPCKILFGESGMGKSSAVKADASEVQENPAGSGNQIVLVDIGGATSVTDLQALILNDPFIREWNATDTGAINIHLDSLDEAIPAYNPIAKGLAFVLRQLRREGLRLTIACRAGEFPPVLDDDLDSLFGPDNVSRWQLLPLSRNDIREAAVQNGIDPDAFMEEVWRGNLQPLAARPITLDLLLRAARSGEGLLTDVRALYERGCRELLSEYPGSSRSTQSHRLDIDQRMAVAGRVACVTVLGAQMVIDADPRENSNVGSVMARAIAGDQEIARGNAFGIGNDDVLEVLRTGLFTATGNCYRWVHKSYAEFMAARHICVSGMKTRNKVALITAVGRVPAPLRGVAGWLTSLDADVRSEILRTDPEALLGSDLSLATDGQKAEIVSWLIREGEAGSPLLYEFGICQKYRSLKHHQLGAQLEPVIESSTSFLARRCAIEVAEACEEETLQPRLATLALDVREPLHLRIAAASSVAEHGNDETRARLLPLLVMPVTDDEERLKVQAIEAVWPNFCSWNDLKNALGGSDYSLTTGLGRFVGFDLVERMKPEDWAPALVWLAGAGHSVGRLYAWSKFGDRLMDKAGQSTDATAHSALVDVAHARLSDSENMFVDTGNTKTDHEPWPEASRRTVAAGLVPRLGNKIYAASRLVNTEKPLLIAADFDFVVESWKSGGNDEALLWQTIAAYLVRWDDPREAEAALSKTSALSGLHSYLLDWQTRLRNREQEAHDKKTNREDEKSRIRETRINRIRECLSASQADPAAFAQLLYIMSFPVDSELGHGPHDAISRLPGWEVLDIEERMQLIQAGKLFLERTCPHVWRGLRHGQLTNGAVYGYCLLLELFGTERAYLDQLPQGLWHRWILGIIVSQCYGGGESDPAWRDGLLTLGIRKSELRAIRTLAVVLRRSGGHRVTSVMKTMDRAIPSRGSETGLIAALRSRQVKKDIYCQGMQLLLARGVQEALRFIEENIRRIADAPDTELPRLGWDAALRLRHSGAAAWPDLWNIIQTRPVFVLPLLEALGGESEMRGALAERLSDDDLAAFYVWLRAQFGVSPDGAGLSGRPEWVMQNVILSVLHKRTSAESVSALESLARQFRDEWYLQKVAWEARRELLDSQWAPFGTDLIKKVVADRRQMIVRDEEELAGAVWDALVDYQASIRGEGSRLLRLWNEPGATPKNEEAISREISHELQQMLLSRGASVTCETKIREGQLVDIYMTSVLPGKDARKLSLIIEVKGCWHEDVMKALETQLAMRYLRDNLSRHGLYLVAWFKCDRWNGDDYRKHRTPPESPDELRTLLDNQAKDANADSGSAIRAFVLDASFEGGEPQSKSRGTKKAVKP